MDHQLQLSEVRCDRHQRQRGFDGRLIAAGLSARKATTKISRSSRIILSDKRLRLSRHDRQYRHPVFTDCPPGA
jgi:hypothetical protein